jgi:hypothetical protein
MAMQPRERMLALGLGLTVGLIVLYWGFNQYQSIFRTREGRIRSLSKEVDTKSTQVALITKAMNQRRELQERSLPSNEINARSEYGNWLLNLVSGKLTEPVVTYQTVRRGKAEGYIPIGFEVKGKGTMEQITRVLYDFYAASHLHQIFSVDLQPEPKGNNFNLTMRVEGIILPETDRKDKLSEEPNRTLAFGSASDYQKAITGRNLFAEYTPPAVRPTGTPLDLANLAYLTNVGHGVDQRPFAWIYERSANKNNYLFEGDSFQIAGISGKVKRIDIGAKTVELEIDGKTVTLGQEKSLGETLAALRN